MNHKKRTNSKSKNEAVVDFRMFAGGSTGKIGTAKLVLVSAELRPAARPRRMMAAASHGGTQVLNPTLFSTFSELLSARLTMCSATKAGQKPPE